MKRTAKIALGVGAALSLGLAAAVVSAHPEGYGPGWGYGPRHFGGGMGGYGMGGFGPGPGFGMGGYGMGRYGGAGAGLEGRLAAQKAELKITPEQESAWQGYADQVTQSADAMFKLHTTMRDSTAATVIERRALHNEVMKQRLAQSEATDAAFKKLYEALSTEQRAIVDRGYVASAPGARGPGGRFR